MPKPSLKMPSNGASRSTTISVPAVASCAVPTTMRRSCHSVAEVADNALVVRFKLKTRPGNISTIQDRTLRQMLKEMPNLGIAFAT